MYIQTPINPRVAPSSQPANTSLHQCTFRYTLLNPIVINQIEERRINRSFIFEFLRVDTAIRYIANDTPIAVVACHEGKEELLKSNSLLSGLALLTKALTIEALMALPTIDIQIDTINLLYFLYIKVMISTNINTTGGLFSVDILVIIELSSIECRVVDRWLHQISILL